MGGFKTTHWSIVLAAGMGAGPDSDRALALLCERYWYPIYCFIRRSGSQHTEAEDLTQEFFARLLKRNYFQHLTPENGRFRSYLLGALKHFLSDSRDRSFAKKRGLRRTISLTAGDPEARYVSEPADHLTPERIFQRQWALSLLESAFIRLEKEYASDGKQRLFALLRPAITRSDDAQKLGRIARELKSSEAAVKMAASRMRQRYRQVLEEEAAGTLANVADVNSEIDFLLSVLSD